MQQHCRVLVFLLALMSFSARCNAQHTVNCPSPPSQVKITVVASITFNAATKLYTYRYSLASAPESKTPLVDFALDFASPISKAASPNGWGVTLYRGRSTELWDAGIGSPLPTGVPDSGQITVPIAALAPGKTLSGFSLQSPNPPGPVKYYALGFADIMAEATEEEAEAAMDACPESTGGFFDRALVGITQGPVLFIPVTIEVNPSHSLASIHHARQGVTTVAVLSSPGFDASTIDPRTVKFGPAAAAAIDSTSHLADVNNDGKLDLVLDFSAAATGIKCDDLSAALTGKTKNGTPIRGTGPAGNAGCKHQSPEPPR